MDNQQKSSAWKKLLIALLVLILIVLVGFIVLGKDGGKRMKDKTGTTPSSEVAGSSNTTGTLPETSDFNFHNEKEFQTAIGNTSFVEKPHTFKVSCADQQIAGLPDQQGDDYLHEERFTSFEHILLFDHIATRKMLNIIIPEANNPAINLCNINITLTDPKSGETVTFYDVYNWVDDEGQAIFNTNKKVYQLWGYSSGNIELGVDQVHAPTGTHLDHGHTSLIVSETGITQYAQ